MTKGDPPDPDTVLQGVGHIARPDIRVFGVPVMETIGVVVNGILGKMGQEVLKALCRETDMDPVGGADKSVEGDFISLPDGSGVIPVSSSLESVIGDAQVVVDLTNAEGALSAIRTVAAHKINVVSGSTGISESGIKEAATLSLEHQVGILIAPNFAIGAVLMIHMV